MTELAPIDRMKAYVADLIDVRDMAQDGRLAGVDLGEGTIEDVERGLRMVIVLQREILRQSGWTDAQIDAAVGPIPPPADAAHHA